MREFTECDLREMRKCPLFSGLSGKKLETALDFFDACIRIYKKGQMLHIAGDRLAFFGLVLSGTVQVYEDDIDGNQMIMNNVTAGHTFGESLCYLRCESRIYIKALTDCRILAMAPVHVNRYDRKMSDTEAAFSERFTAMLAERTLAMNRRIQILSKLTLREKLITFFTEYSQKADGEGGYFTVPFQRDDMAVYLGTNRSALSRELSKMKKEGVIDFERNRFRILR